MEFPPLFCYVTTIKMPILEDLLCTVFAGMDDRIWIATCLKKLAHFLCFFKKISVLTMKMPKSKGFRV